MGLKHGSHGVYSYVLEIEDKVVLHSIASSERRNSSARITRELLPKTPGGAKRLKLNHRIFQSCLTNRHKHCVSADLDSNMTRFYATFTHAQDSFQQGLRTTGQSLMPSMLFKSSNASFQDCLKAKKEKSFCA